MFTGIIEAIGSLTECLPRDDHLRVVIDTGSLPLDGIRIGDSVAVNGVCLTVTEYGERSIAADVSMETLRCTTLGSLGSGARVNLERALRLGDRLGGHLVSGHIDGVGLVSDRRQAGDDLVFEFTVADALTRYISRKGSVGVDGVSLTVNAVDGTRFAVQIIPHTRDATLFGGYRIGDRVNIEVDLLARYLERLIESRSAE